MQVQKKKPLSASYLNLLGFQNQPVSKGKAHPGVGGFWSFKQWEQFPYSPSENRQSLPNPTRILLWSLCCSCSLGPTLWQLLVFDGNFIFLFGVSGQLRVLESSQCENRSLGKARCSRDNTNHCNGSKAVPNLPDPRLPIHSYF